jgi:hypothetical protein
MTCENTGGNGVCSERKIVFLFSPVFFLKKHADTRSANDKRGFILPGAPARKTGHGGLKGAQFQKRENRSFTALQKS